MGSERSAGSRAQTSVAMEILLVVVVGVTADLFFWRGFIGSGFDLISGNLGDNRLIIALHEHWYSVFAGRDSWQRPLFLFPAPNVLGFSDTTFLGSLVYSIGRILGADVYIAFQLNLIAFSLIGFFSAYVLCRRYLGMEIVPSLLGSVAFAFSTSMSFTRCVAQNVYVYLAPVLLILLCAFVRDLAAEQWRALRSGVPFAVLLAAVLFSWFNFGWFFVLFLGLAGGFSVVLEPAILWRAPTKRRLAIVAVVAFAFVVAMVPFLQTYLPVVFSGLRRSYEEALPHLLAPSQMFNFAGDLWQALGWPPVGISDLSQFSATPGVVLGVLVAGAAVLVGCARNRSGVPSLPDRVLLAVFLSILVGWLLVLDVGGVSAWWLAFQIIPGASANRVVARFQYILSLFSCLVLFYSLNRVWISGGTVTRWLIAAFALFVVAEQPASFPVDGISRREEHARLADIPAPPASAEAFFLIAADVPPAQLSSPWPFLIAQIDAMLIAERFGLPTINGYSGWSPPGWRFGLPTRQNSKYSAEVVAWVEKNGFRGRIAALDLARRQWIVRPSGLTARSSSAAW